MLSLLAQRTTPCEPRSSLFSSWNGFPLPDPCTWLCVHLSGCAELDFHCILITRGLQLGILSVLCPTERSWLLWPAPLKVQDLSKLPYHSEQWNVGQHLILQFFILSKNICKVFPVGSSLYRGGRCREMRGRKRCRKLIRLELLSL